MMDIKVNPQTMKRISAEEASTQYRVLTSKYPDGLRYYITSEGLVIDSDGNIRYMPWKNYYVDHTRVTELENGVFKCERSTDILFDTVDDTKYCDTIEDVFYDPITDRDVYCYIVGNEHFLKKADAMKYAKTYLQQPYNRHKVTITNILKKWGIDER